MRDDAQEISDVIVSYDPSSLKRRPVKQADAIDALRGPASPYAHQIVKDIPQSNGILNNEAVDQLLISAHSELQRMWEEFFHGPRVALILQHLVKALRKTGISRKLRVVDVGCGPGFTLRWLAAHEILKDEVTWIGADYNAALIGHAQNLAQAERLPVQFVLARSSASLRSASSGPGACYSCPFPRSSPQTAKNNHDQRRLSLPCSAMTTCIVRRVLISTPDAESV